MHDLLRKMQNTEGNIRIKGDHSFTKGLILMKINLGVAIK